MQVNNKIFIAGLVIAVFGWAIAWFLENGVFGVSLFSLGFIVAFIGLVWSFKDIGKGSLSKSRSTISLPISKVGVVTGLAGIGFSVLGGILDAFTGEEKAAEVLFYLGFALIAIAIVIHLYRFITAK